MPRTDILRMTLWVLAITLVVNLAPIVAWAGERP